MRVAKIKLFLVIKPLWMKGLIILGISVSSLTLLFILCKVLEVLELISLESSTISLLSLTLSTRLVSVLEMEKDKSKQVGKKKKEDEVQNMPDYFK